jgi:adenylate cyclase
MYGIYRTTMSLVDDRFAGSKILIIDDSKTSLFLMKKMVLASNFIPIVFQKGLDGIEYLKSELVDIILTAYHLSDMTATDLIKTVKETYNKDIPFIIISGDDSEETVIEGLSNGADEFLSKPILPSILKLRVNSILQKRIHEKQVLSLNEKLKKEKSLLTKYFSDDLVEEILNETIIPDVGGVSTSVSILFFDLRGSTALSEGMSPSIFAEFLSSLFTDIMDIIFANKGSVNKLLGDGILATFGVPFNSDEDIPNCLNCAISIEEYFLTVNSIGNPYTNQSIGFGIGIASGKVFAGNVGSFRRMEYTVMGETVNIASRLETTTKDVGKTILVDETTCKGAGQGYNFTHQSVNSVRGKKGKIEIYSLDGKKK